MFKNQILHRNSLTSLGKSEDLVFLGLEVHSLVWYSPRTHSLHSLTYYGASKRPQEVRGRVGGWEDAASWRWSPHRPPPAPGRVVVAASPTGLPVLQIAGCIRMEPSSSWAGSHSSLKRSSGLPTAYPTPSALQTTSAYWLASGWKSPPHDGLPGEERFFSSRRAHRIRDCGNIPRFWKLRSKKLNVPSPPPPHSLLPHG